MMRSWIPMVSTWKVWKTPGGKASAPRRAPFPAQPTAQPTPTFVPTIVPISGAPLVQQVATPTPIPTSTFGEPTSEPSLPVRSGPPLILTVVLLGICCLFILILFVVGLVFFLRAQNRKGGNNA